MRLQTNWWLDGKLKTAAATSVKPAALKSGNEKRSGVAKSSNVAPTVRQEEILKVKVQEEKLMMEAL